MYIYIYIIEKPHGINYKNGNCENILSFHLLKHLKFVFFLTKCIMISKVKSS